MKSLIPLLLKNVTRSLWTTITGIVLLAINAAVGYYFEAWETENSLLAMLGVALVLAPDKRQS